MNDSQAGLIFADTTPTNKWHIGYFSPASLPPSGGLVVTESGVADYRMTFLAGGNVGIGTATPAHTLDVTGDIQAIDVCTDVGGVCLSTQSGLTGRVVTAGSIGCGYYIDVSEGLVTGGGRDVLGCPASEPGGGDMGGDAY